LTAGRLGWAATALTFALGGAAWFMVQHRPSARDPLGCTAQAYSALGDSLTAVGLLPFPSDRAGLEAARAAQLAAAPPLTATTSGKGQPVYRLGAVLIVMTTAGKPDRYLLSPAHAPELGVSDLGRALQQLAALPLSAQRPLEIGNKAGLPVYDQAFYFDYSHAGQTWRFTPQFEGERCSRIDVELLEK
jgi:hypothetical protein